MGDLTIIGSVEKSAGQGLVNDLILDFVVPIHGNWPLNRLFFESLRSNTRYPFRLFVVDNHSPDESGDYFKKQKGEGFEVIVLSNSKNQCYPISMNQGLSLTTSRVVGLLNNDIVFSPGWDVPLVDHLLRDDGCVASPIGLEHLPEKKIEELMFSRWRRILKRHYSEDEYDNLRMKVEQMYGDLNVFSSWIKDRYKDFSFLGIMGHCHLVSRPFLSLIKELDQRMQGADWDLYLTAARMVEKGELSVLPQIIGGSYVHHFIRATAKKKNLEPVLCDHAPHLTIEEKWSIQEIQKYWPFEEQRPHYKKTLRQRFRKKIIRMKSWMSRNNRDLISILNTQSGFHV